VAAPPKGTTFAATGGREAVAGKAVQETGTAVVIIGAAAVTGTAVGAIGTPQ